MSWLDLLDRDGRLIARRSVDTLPFSVGSGADAGLVAAGLGLEPHHADVRRDEHGAVIVRSAAMGAGLRRPDSGDLLAQATLVAGIDLLLGDVRLRLIDVVAPEAVTGRTVGTVGTVGTVAGGPPAPWTAWAGRRFGWLVIPLLASAVMALLTYVESTDTSAAAAASKFGVGLLGISLIWASGWAFATRLRRGEARFGRHFAVASVGLAMMLIVSGVGNWLPFLAPEAIVTQVAAFAIGVVIWLIAIVPQLGVMGVSLAKRGGAIVAIVALGLSACTAWGGEIWGDDKPAQVTWAAAFKVAPAAMVPAESLDTFAVDVGDLEKGLLAQKDDTIPISGTDTP